MAAITGLIVASIVGALAAAGASIYSATANANAVKNTNQQNIDLQNEVNKQNQYNIEHAHQIEMADLQAAGLNPVLTATGGSGAPIQALNAAKASAPQIDLSGVSSALSGLSHMATMAMMMDTRQEIAQERNNTLTAIAHGKNAQSAANAVLRKQTLDALYRRKAASFASEGMANIGSAKQIHNASKMSDKELNRKWNAIMKKMGY